VPRVAGLAVLDDQAAAGVIMWVPGSLAFLPPLFAIGLRLLYGDLDVRRTTKRNSDRQRARLREVSRQSLPILGGHSSGSIVPAPRRPAAFDLLRLPIVGRFLRWRHARLALQLPLAVLAAALIVDGLRGPRTSAMNLAGVLPWIHWRGLLIVGLLAAGNVGCMACPFQLPRTLARRWLPARRTWPPWLRSKWLAVLLVAVFLWAYEALSLWNSPWWTAWIAVGYFVSAFVVDGIFRGASFCKYVCPIGQFNFVQSLVSPLEVKVRQPDVCEACETKDCIRGRGELPGCELGLFLPMKAGNLDCTFCLDCIHACPHDNIGMLAAVPGKDLWTDPVRSGVGRLAKRPDLAALILVLVFGAFANAAGMVGPVVDWQERLQAVLRQQSPFLVTSAYYLLALFVLPVAAVAAAAFLSQRWGGLKASRLDVATRYSFALVPLGFAMWFSHYSFHFLTSFETVIPVTQRFAADLGWPALGTPEWGLACCRRVADWLPRLEIVALELGLLLSLFAGYRLSLAHAARPSQALRVLAPWAMLLVLLFVAGVWIVFQPMQMRGTLLGAR
jgi:ferredoxin